VLHVCTVTHSQTHTHRAPIKVSCCKDNRFKKLKSANFSVPNRRVNSSSSTHSIERTLTVYGRGGDAQRRHVRADASEQRVHGSSGERRAQTQLAQCAVAGDALRPRTAHRVAHNKVAGIVCKRRRQRTQRRHAKQFAKLRHAVGRRLQTCARARVTTGTLKRVINAPDNVNDVRLLDFE
jgi:hypothetical protein